MSWITSCQRVLSSSPMAASRGYAVPATMWDKCVTSFHFNGRCFVFLERKFIRNFILQGLRFSGARMFTSVAPPAVEKKANCGDRKKRLGKERDRESLQSVVVVESPSKAKTIAKCLGPRFTVLPSFGHVRDLASRAGSVRPDDDFKMLWEVPASARPHINSMKAALKRAQVLVLASDPDREGEAIAWHILEMLKMEGALTKGIQVKRVMFHEITKTAVLRAMESARDVSETLVDAYLARRALDYLIGFNLSPVLWRKLPGSRSAGRVQSAALRLICDREQEIEAFQSREYWSVETQLKRDGDLDGVSFSARLSHLNGEKLGQFSVTNDVDVQSASKKVSEAILRVESVKKGLVRRRSPVPYITSTLQQDASAKLGFGATRTMSIAHQLYEGVKLNDDEQTGLITYMRTDSFQISAEALDNIRDLVASRYGQEYVPAEMRVLVSKLRNTQEAHEAIRPTDIFRLPSSLAEVLEEDALQLYSLVWARTVACQMEPAVSSQVSVYVVDDDNDVQLSASSSSVSFSGFLEAYKDTAALGKSVEILQNKDDGGSTPDLNQLEPGDLVKLLEFRPRRDFTEPPPRYSEGTLVKQLEELGIGRPSSYAPSLRTLQLRNYMRIDEHRIFPQVRGRMVSAFLIYYFPEFTDFALTANMERQLDDVSAGRANWKEVLRNFWPEFHADVVNAMKVPISKVAVLLEELLAKQLFPSTSAGAGARVCPSCKEGKVSLKLSRFGVGYFFGCSRHPNCLFKANMVPGDEDELSSDESSETPDEQWSATARPAKVLGVDPTTQLEVVMRVGPYGAFVQLGETSKYQKPPRTAIPKGVKAEEVTLTKALELLSYPRELGMHPVEGTPIIISIGKFGFTLRHRAVFAHVPQGVKVEKLSLEKAVEILKGKNVSRRGRRPRRKPVEETSQSSSPQIEGESSLPHNAPCPSASQEQQSKKGVKLHTKKLTQDSNSDTLPKGVNSVTKKRGRGRKPKKNVAVSESSSELLLVQGEEAVVI